MFISRSEQIQHLVLKARPFGSRKKGEVIEEFKKNFIRILYFPNKW